MRWEQGPLPGSAEDIPREGEREGGDFLKP